MDDMDSWKKITEECYYNQEYIFPTQQQDVLKIVKKATACANIKKVVIFGSSVTAQCNPWSDIDVYLEQEAEFPEITFEDLENPVDRWTNFTADGALMEEINKKGVCVYEK